MKNKPRFTMVCHVGHRDRCLRAFGDWIADYQTHNNQPLLLTAEVPSKKRTDAQNRYLWPMLREIAKAVQERSGEPCTAEDMHDYFLTRFIGMQSRWVFGEEIKTLPKTSDMQVPQLSYFIDRCMEWAADREIYAMQPSDYQDWAANAAS